MAEKINIEDLMVESYSDKTLKAYSGMIADPKSVFGLGSAQRRRCALHPWRCAPCG